MKENPAEFLDGTQGFLVRALWAALVSAMTVLAFALASS